MRIGLVDVDGHNFPNICLMKLSAYHKAKGDEVEFAVPLLPYDRIYMARVFDDTYTHDDLTAYQCTDVRRGGVQGTDWIIRCQTKLNINTLIILCMA